MAAGVPIHLTSAKTLESVEELKQYITPGKTVAFVGFSGAGKSALINSLCRVDLMKTGAVRGDDLKGRHTTTHKQLILLEQGGILIDSPGIKELQLWGNEESLDASFDDIAEIAEGCKFRDCSHTGELGCAVQNVLDTGELDHRIFENFLDMKKELIFLESLEKNCKLFKVNTGRSHSINIVAGPIKFYSIKALILDYIIGNHFSLFMPIYFGTTNFHIVNSGF